MRSGVGRVWRSLQTAIGVPEVTGERHLWTRNTEWAPVVFPGSEVNYGDGSVAGVKPWLSIDSGCIETDSILRATTVSTVFLLPYPTARTGQAFDSMTLPFGASLVPSGWAAMRPLADPDMRTRVGTISNYPPPTLHNDLGGL